jgi:hypothetical protein
LEVVAESSGDTIVQLSGSGACGVMAQSDSIGNLHGEGKGAEHENLDGIYIP